MIYNGNDYHEPAEGTASNSDETDPLGYEEKQRKPEMKKKKKGMMSLLKSSISKKVISPIEELLMEPIVDDDDDINDDTISFSANESISSSCLQRTMPTEHDEMVTLLAKMEKSNSDMKVLLLDMKKNNELSVEEIKKTNVRLDDMETQIGTSNKYKNKKTKKKKMLLKPLYVTEKSYRISTTNIDDRDANNCTATTDVVVNEATQNTKTENNERCTTIIDDDPSNTKTDTDTYSKSILSSIFNGC